MAVGSARGLAVMKPGWPKGRKRSEENKAKCRASMLSRWQDPVYRAKHAPEAAARMLWVREIALAKRAAMFPKRHSPEGKYYRKLRNIVGAKAAREALGIGQ